MKTTVKVSCLEMEINQKNSSNSFSLINHTNNQQQIIKNSTLALLEFLQSNQGISMYHQIPFLVLDTP